MSLAAAQQAASALGFQVFTGCPAWSALDELHLLDAIEKYGFGNWRDIGSHVGKPLLECKQHYEQVYLTSSEAPLPEQARLAERATNADQAALAPDEVVKQVLAQQQSAAAGPQAPPAGDAPSSEPAVAVVGPKHGPDEELLTRGGKSAPRSRSRGRSKSKSRGGGSGSSSGAAAGSSAASAPGVQPPSAAAAADDHALQVVDPDISGFLPLRGDFEVEWDNDAELMLADMEFREGEHPTETELKLKVVEIYNAKLDERERRKRFVLERGLLDFKARLSDERRRPREEREIRNMLRPFARFHSHTDHETLVESLMEEHRIRRRIAQLQHWRRNGVRTLAEADEYEKAKQFRARERKQRRQREQASHLYGTAASLGSAVGGSSQSRSRRRERYASRATEPAAAAAASEAPAVAGPAKRPRADVKPEAATGGSDGAPAATPLEPSSTWTSSSSSTAAAVSAGPGTDAGTGGVPPPQEGSAVAMATPSLPEPVSRPPPSSAAGSMATGPNMAAAAPSGGANGGSGDPVDEFSVADAPGAGLLSELERSVCGHLRLLPSQLLHIKGAVQAASKDSARSAATAAEAGAGAAEGKGAAAFDMCVSAGWVKTDPGPKLFGREPEDEHGPTPARKPSA